MNDIPKLEPEELYVDDTSIEEEDATAFKYDITSYGADYPVDALVKRLEQADIRVPDFQREYVWSFPQACKFIESILLGLPIPGIFLHKDDESKELWVIDGQQRLRTLQYFVKGTFNEKLFKLKGVQEELSGLAYETLPDDRRRDFDDTVIHATVVKQDAPEFPDRASIYLVFERLNTGGTPLQPQEIRNCVWRGKLNELVKELNKFDVWRDAFGRPTPHSRMKDQELILRFFALLHKGKESGADGPPVYQRPMKGFLNDFLSWNRDLVHLSAETLTREFKDAVTTIRKSVEGRLFRLGGGALNAAVADSVMCGVSRRLTSGHSKPDPTRIQSAYEQLIADPDFATACRTSTADPQNVVSRLTLAERAFADC